MDFFKLEYLFLACSVFNILWTIVPRNRIIYCMMLIKVCESFQKTTKSHPRRRGRRSCGKKIILRHQHNLYIALLVGFFLCAEKFDFR